MDNHPLYKRVQQIVISKSIKGIVKQSEFNGIRNQPSVRAILTDMGYMPNCETNAFTWKMKGFASSNIGKRSRTTKASDTSLVADRLEAGKDVYIDEVDVTKHQLQKIISYLKNRGWLINSINKNNVVLGYRLTDK